MEFQTYLRGNTTFKFETPIPAIPCVHLVQVTTVISRLFTVFERIIDKINAENLELYLMGDLIYYQTFSMITLPTS